jgi:hypothetical protein
MSGRDSKVGPSNPGRGVERGGRRVGEERKLVGDLF